jgi:hypothetical protein
MPKILAAIPPDVRDLLTSNRGMFSSSDAHRAGITRGRIRRLLAANLLERVGDGLYVATAAYEALDAWERFLVRARAFSASSPAAFLTGWAAAVMWRLPTIRSPPILPVALRPREGPGGSKLTPYGKIVVANLPHHHRWRMGSTRVVSRAWAALEVARSCHSPTHWLSPMRHRALEPILPKRFSS